MSTYKFCGGTCPQCPPGSTAYACIYNIYKCCCIQFMQWSYPILSTIHHSYLQITASSYSGVTLQSIINVTSTLKRKWLVQVILSMIVLKNFLSQRSQTSKESTGWQLQYNLYGIVIIQYTVEFQRYNGSKSIKVLTECTCFKWNV